MEYKICQDQFLTNRTSLAKKIIDGIPLCKPEVLPTVTDVEKYFGAIFEDPSPPDTEPVIEATNNISMSQPITSEELDYAIKSWRHSAPGPDGITVDQVKACPPALLLLLFNIILYRRFTPSLWKLSRTIILEKEGDRKDPGNWRPITIGPAVQRLLHRILAKRFSQRVELHHLQRGFRSIDGTFANTILVEHYIRARRASGKAYNLVSLDVRKAFDTVSHHAILRALIRKGIDPSTREYIMSSLDAQTIIKVGRSFTRPLCFKRGVKQGDPLSPFLFNLVLDELIMERNTNSSGGTITPRLHVAAIGFADDLVLLEDKDTDMALSLIECNRFFTARGMALNAKKSVAVTATRINGTSVPRTKSIFRVGGSPIISVADADTFRYLGHYIGAAGTVKPTIYRLCKWLRNIERAPLKPHQKLAILKQHLIPRLLYGLQVPSVTAGILAECDRLVRKTVKRTLHLSGHTGDQFLYACLRDGGLGIPQLRRKIPAIMASRLATLFTSDETTAAIEHAEPTATLVNKISRLTSVGNPEAYWKEQISTRPFSKGLESAADNVASRGWISNIPTGWTGRDYVRAVQLRTNNLPCRGLPYNPPALRKCRAGCDRVESLSHILQGCPVTHFERIKRHNEIVEKVARHIRTKKWSCEVEHRVRHTDGQLFIPDLVIHKPDTNTTIVCDVQVCWEGPRSLTESWTAK